MGAYSGLYGSKGINCFSTSNVTGNTAAGGISGDGNPTLDFSTTWNGEEWISE